jgi:hypothetical protein
VNADEGPMTGRTFSSLERMNAPTSRTRWAPVLLALAGLLFNTSFARAAPQEWGAIAARPGGYGYSFHQGSRAAAEQAARVQCERAAGRPGPCEVRVYFERSCAALATGNFGEWGAAVGVDAKAAGQAAVAQCDAHLPTEPCKLVVSVCSLP